MFTYKLNVGDFYDDGHGRYDSYYVRTNASIKEMDEDYQIAKRDLGFDLKKDICSDYEEYGICNEYAIEWLNSLCLGIVEEKSKHSFAQYRWHKGIFEGYGKFEVEDVDWEKGVFESLTCSPDFFVYMHTKYLESAGNNKYELIKEKIDGMFNIGGYGMYE